MSKAAKQVSEIDRLIDLASDHRAPSGGDAGASPAPPAGASVQLADPADSRPSMWRVLLQLRPLLPHLARLLPLLERGVLGTNVLGSIPAPVRAADTSRFDRGIAEIEEAHRELALAVENQTGEIKHLQERIAWLGSSLAKAAGRQEEIADRLASFQKMATVGAAVLVVLLLGLTGAVAFFALQRRP